MKRCIVAVALLLCVGCSSKEDKFEKSLNKLNDTAFVAGAVVGAVIDRRMGQPDLRDERLRDAFIEAALKLRNDVTKSIKEDLK